MSVRWVEGLERLLHPDPITPHVTDPHVSGCIYANQQPSVLADPTGMGASWPGPGDLWDAVQAGLKNGVTSAVGIAGAVAEWGDLSGSGMVLRQLSGKLPSEYFYGATVKYPGITGREPIARIRNILTNLLSGGGISIVCIKTGTKAGAALLRSLLLKSSKSAATAVPALPKALSGGAADTYVSFGIRNGKSVYTGITNNLTRRGAQHGDRFDQLQCVTNAPVTRG